MHRLQEIIRFLTAAGGTPSRDGNGTHFTYEDEGSIRMRTWTGPELIDDELIADGVRPGTSAPIVNRSHKRIFVVDKDDSIRCFTDPLGDGAQVEEDEIDDDVPWSEKEIADVDTRVHSQSQLAVSYDKNTIFVFYQKPDGNLGCINEYNNQWKDVKLPAAAALAGTPLATCNTNYAVFLFYISTDGTVRYLENREGKWNDVFFSAAKIIDPKAELPGSAFRLTVAEDRQPFERIRPMVFCLDSKDLSIIRFRSKKLDTIGRVDGTEFVPSLGNRERNKYYFWSPYPFYTMIKRRGNTLAQVTTSKRLWTQCIKRSHPQQERGKSSAMEHLNRLQEPPIDNHNAPMTNNKTPATVGLETTNAQAIIPPQTSAQQEIISNIPARSSIFVGFGSITHPLSAIRRRLFGNGRNEDAVEEDFSESIESNHADIVDVLPRANESEMNRIEGGVIESNGVETGRSEAEETRLEETEVERPQVDESSMQVEAEEDLIREDRPENRPEEADSDGSEEEAGSEETHSEAADTAPSEVEVEIEENQSQKVQAEQARNEEAEGEESEGEESEGEESEGEESEGEESEGEESEGEESEGKEVEEVEDKAVGDEDVQHKDVQNEKIQVEESQTKEAQTKEAQTKEAQTKEAQTKEAQTKEVQTKEVQIEEAQITSSRTDDDAPKTDAKPEESEAIIPKVDSLQAKERELNNVTWREPEAEPASDKLKVPTTKSSTTKYTEGLPATKPSVTKESGQEADVMEYLDPKTSEHTESPTVGKGKGRATTDTPILNEPRYNTPQDIQEDMADYIKNADLGSFYPTDSPNVPTLAKNAFDLKKNKKNSLNRDIDIQRITRLNLYQPVLYCDDSTSMKVGTRVKDQKEMVKRITRISTSIVPKDYGTSLQFINHIRDVHEDKLSQKQVEAIMKSVKPTGHTEIGTNLKKKILQPLVYDVINNNERIERPILVSCITDGCPSHEPSEKFKETILECVRILKDNGYPPSTIRFQVSQIGNSSSADKYLKKLGCDPDLSQVVYCTAQRLDEQFSELRDNEVMLERWLLRTLMEPIMGQDINSLNL